MYVYTHACIHNCNCTLYPSSNKDNAARNWKMHALEHECNSLTEMDTNPPSSIKQYEHMIYLYCIMYVYVCI